MIISRASLLLVFLAVGAAAAEEPPARVVLLYDERIVLPGLATLEGSLTRGLTGTLTSSIELYREEMDLSRFESDSYLPVLVQYLRDKYAGTAVDVVVAVMGPALDFLIRHGDAVFPGARIVFCGIDRRSLDVETLPPHVTGVLVEREFAPTLELALTMHPDTTRVVFIGGASQFDVRVIRQARTELGAYEARVDIDFWTGRSLSELVRDVSELPPGTLVLYSTLFRDATGASHAPYEAAERLAAATSVPMYGFLDQYVGRGIVGGHVYSLDGHGTAAADLVLRVLGGAAPSALPITEGGGSIDLFDWRQIQAWGIDDDRLPSGSQVIFRASGVWTEYWWPLVGGVTALVAQTLLIGTLVLQRRKQKTTQFRLAEAEKRYRTVADHATDWVFWLKLDGGFAYVSPSCETVTGYTVDELMANPGLLYEMIAEEDHERWTDHLRCATETASGTEVRVHTRTGELRWLDVSVVRVMEAGRDKGVRCGARDVTAGRQAEQEVREGTTEAQRLRGSVVPGAADAARTAPQTLEEVERDYIRRTLEQRHWRIEGPNGVARVLGLNASTLRSRMRKLGLRRPDVTPRVRH